MELMMFRELALDKDIFKRKVRKVNFSLCTKIADAKALYSARAWSFISELELILRFSNKT